MKTTSSRQVHFQRLWSLSQEYQSKRRSISKPTTGYLKQFDAINVSFWQFLRRRWCHVVSVFHATFSRPASRSKCWSMDQVVQLYSSTDTVTAWENSRNILSEEPDFQVIDNLSITVHDFSMRMIIYMRYCYLGMWKRSTNFRGLLFNVELAPSCFKYVNSVLSEFT